MDNFVCLDKINTLVADLLTTEAWKEFVFPQLLEKKVDLNNKAANGTLNKNDKAILEVFRIIAKISLHKESITGEEALKHEIKAGKGP